MTTGVSARTGKDGKAVINGKTAMRLTQWTINASVSETAWGDSDSQGYTSRKEARWDATGSLTGKMDSTSTSRPYAYPSASAHIPGLVSEIVLWETSSTPEYWVFPSALIQNFSLTVDQNTKEVIEWTLDFAADGKYWRPAQTNQPSRTYPS